MLKVFGIIFLTLIALIGGCVGCAAFAVSSAVAEIPDYVSTESVRRTYGEDIEVVTARLLASESVAHAAQGMRASDHLVAIFDDAGDDLYGKLDVAKSSHMVWGDTGVAMVNEQTLIVYSLMVNERSYLLTFIDVIGPAQ